MEKEPSRIFQKCCFCVPLRGGLFFLAYLNVVAGVFTLALDLEGLLPWSLMDVVADATGFMNAAIFYLPNLIDLAYGAALLYALHKNDILVLYAYIWYSVTYIMIILYISLMIWGYVLYPNAFVLSIAVCIFYQGFMAFLVRNLRVETIRTTGDSAKEKRMSYSPRQATNDCEMESQPLPTAPHAHPSGSVQDYTSL